MVVEELECQAVPGARMKGHRHTPTSERFHAIGLAPHVRPLQTLSFYAQMRVTIPHFGNLHTIRTFQYTTTDWIATSSLIHRPTHLHIQCHQKQYVTSTPPPSRPTNLTSPRSYTTTPASLPSGRATSSAPICPSHAQLSTMALPTA